MVLVIIFALWLTIRKLRKRPRLEYRIEDYAPELPQAKIDNPDLDYAQAEIERLEALKLEYMEVLDCVEREQQALRREYDSASAKRQSAIATRLTTLANKHASATKTLSSFDSKIEKAYYKLNA